jgi:hypothetical protein
MIASEGGNRRYVALVGRFTLNSATPVANYQKTPNSGLSIGWSQPRPSEIQIYYPPDVSSTIHVPSAYRLILHPQNWRKTTSLLWQIAIGSTTPLWAFQYSLDQRVWASARYALRVGKLCPPGCCLSVSSLFPISETTSWQARQKEANRRDLTKLTLRCN